MHDRTIDGEIFVFGNQGGLFMNAMTWFDHQTGSVWSQVWGQAIAGPLKGTTLDLIAAAIVPWDTWKSQHPETLAMTTGKSGGFSRTEPLSGNWVAGIVLGEHSKAFDFRALVRQGIVNDFVGPFPVAVIADRDTRDIRAYLRQVDEKVLTLSLTDDGETLVDGETGSQWRLLNGLGLQGELQEEALLPIPYISSFDWAWLDFHPDSEIYR